MSGQCQAVNGTLNLCGGRGVPCVFSVEPTLQFNCTCDSGWTGFGDFNPWLDNCDIFIPALYFLGAMDIFVSACVLGIVYWAISKRTPKKFIQMLKRRNAVAIITVSGLIIAICQITWMSVRLSNIDGRVLAVDPLSTVCESISVFFVYLAVPHVLMHYAKLTFADSRIKMMDSQARERAKVRARVVTPIVNVILPVLAAVGGFSPTISLNNHSLIKLGLQIMAVSTAMLLLCTLALISILIRPMVHDMILASSINRLTGPEQEVLISATRKLVVFHFVIVSISVAFIPLMLVVAFVPDLRGVVTYIYFLGLQFCAWVVFFSIWTLTNVVKTSGLTPLKNSRPAENVLENPGELQAAADLVSFSAPDEAIPRSIS